MKTTGIIHCKGSSNFMPTKLPTVHSVKNSAVWDLLDERQKMVLETEYIHRSIRMSQSAVLLECLNLASQNNITLDV